MQCADCRVHGRDDRRDAGEWSFARGRQGGVKLRGNELREEGGAARSKREQWCAKRLTEA